MSDDNDVATDRGVQVDDVAEAPVNPDVDEAAAQDEAAGAKRTDDEVATPHPLPEGVSLR